MRQVLGLLLVFGLGILVGNFFQPQAKYALLGSFLQIQDTVSLQMPRGSRTQFLQPDVSTATPSLATPSLAVQQALTMPPPPPAHAEERPTQLRVDGEFLKRDGREAGCTGKDERGKGKAGRLLPTGSQDKDGARTEVLR